MFRSRRREVVFPQRAHALLSAAIAGVWSDRLAPVPLPHERYVLGVARHDRGYAEHDDDEIGRVPRSRWLAIQERGFHPTGEDAVVDLVVALHVRRLVSSGRDTESQRLLAAMDAELPRLVGAAGVSAHDAAAADRVTDLCDRISFDFCLEEPSSGAVEVIATDGTPFEVRYAADGFGTITLEPWPLEPATVSGVVDGFSADGYPGRLDPAPTPFVVEPAGGGSR